MVIKTKFNLNDLCFMVSVKSHFRLIGCSFCLKKGKVKIRKKNHVCPKCQGGRKVRVNVKIRFVDGPLVIKRFEVGGHHWYRDGKSIIMETEKYKLENKLGYYQDYRLFKTRADAELSIT